MTDFTLTRKATSDLTWNLQLQLLTPMVGGGAVARMVDEDQPVSGKAVRGQLRFWWRATRGGRYGQGGLAQMKRDEAWLFGKAATFDKQEQAAGLGPSRVQVRVSIGRKGRTTRFTSSDGPKYASFSLEENRRQGTEAAVVLKDLEFDIQISLARVEDGPLTAEEVKADLEAAIWAWITFGGVGARTRRGFGALARRGEQPTVQQMRQGIKTYVLEGEAPKGVPQLSRQEKDTVLLDGYRNAKDAWYDGIETYQEYRNYRRGDKNNPHRSYWPEADEIRQIMGESSVGHSRPYTQVHKFPRAVFGLPIIFHFRSDGERRGEPGDSTLRGKETDRLASPLVIRPIGNDLLLVTILKTANFPDSPLNNLYLQGKRKGSKVNHLLTIQEAQELEKMRLSDDTHPIRFAPDILATFLKFLKEKLQ